MWVAGGSPSFGEYGGSCEFSARYRQPMPLVSRGGTSTLISCIYFGIILSVSRFGANIGNEDEEEEDTENPENPSDEPSGETINQAVEGEREDNPLSAVETITVESKV